MKKVWQIIYYFWVSPGIIIAAHILAIFSKKIRKGLISRYTTVKKLRQWLKNNNPSAQRVLFHSASLGEFEHIRPVLQALQEKFNTTNFVTFFSPSGYENAGQTKGLDFHFYMPFDRPANWKKIYKAINPTMIIIAKHDVWPGQVWTAREEGIPIFLINASLSKKSSRTRNGVKTFLKYVYRDFESICAISEDDAKRFAVHYPRCRVENVGDTKYDQVVLRKKAAQLQKLLPEKWLEKHWIFMAGSIWPEDEVQLFPAIEKLLREEEKIRFVLVPHQPEEKAISRIEQSFRNWGIQKFGTRDQLNDERFLIVDTVGHLAGLYNHAQAAYVGGSFQQGIHNVMEPSIFGLPVLYGPVHENSYEAIQLAANNGGVIVKNSNDIYQNISAFFHDELKRNTLGIKAEKFATRNTGATGQLITRWKPLIRSAR